MYDSLAKMTAMGSKPKGKKDAMDREAKRDAVAAMRNKVKKSKDTFSYEEIERMKKAGTFYGFDGTKGQTAAERKMRGK